MSESETVRVQVAGDGSPDWKAIADALRGLRFGVVSIIVQDGVIVQIDRTEKRRLRRKSQGGDAESIG
jgi:hypothetical protein